MATQRKSATPRRKAAARRVFDVDTAPRKRIAVKGSYDNARHTDENEKLWQFVDALSAAAANTPQVRQIVRNRARYETANNSYAAGIVETLANDTVGPVVQLQLGDSERAQAMEREDSDREGAQALALEALKLAGDLVPAAALAGRLIAESGNVRRAARLLEKAWKLSPHPEIAEAYINVRAGDSTRDRLKRMRLLASRLPGEREGALAVAGAAIDARDWGAAREALAPHVSAGPTQRVCSLMAEIEEGEHGDSAGVHAWLGRAVRAPRDAAWTADGVVSEHWAPLSPVTGRLDAFQWRVPLAQSEGPQIAPVPGRPEAAVSANGAAI